MKVLDLFAGPGGWDLGARAIGLDPLGVELDDAACKTREAAGLPTVQGDVAALDPTDFGPVDLLIASPPCQAWSMAGKRQGRHDVEEVYALTDSIARGDSIRAALSDPTIEWADERSKLVVAPLGWALELRPRFLAFEQVPPVLDYWHHLAAILRGEGYRVWTGKLRSEQFGVPQTRERAILIADLNGTPAPPTPTHQRYVKGEPAQHTVTIDGELRPWRSMADALDWPPDDRIGFPRRADRGAATEDGYRARDTRSASEPAFNLTEKARSWTRLRAEDRSRATVRSVGEPAPTITAGHDSGERRWENGEGETARVELDEAAVLQGFPANYPWQGSRTARFAQVGNAVPPPLGEAVLRSLLGL